MVGKSERTAELYKTAGAEFRLLKCVAARLSVDASKVLTAADTDKLLKAIWKIDQICSAAEDNMFRDHPDLSDEFLCVFYGILSQPAKNPVDASVAAEAKEVARGIFGE